MRIISILGIESICPAARDEAPVRARGCGCAPPAPSCLRSPAAVDLLAKSLRQFADNCNLKLVRIVRGSERVDCLRRGLVVVAKIDGLE